MTRWRAGISYLELPATVMSAVPEAGFLRACADSYAGTVIVWVLDRRSGTGRREREFSPSEDRFLTRAEREASLPPPREFPLPEQRVHVVQRARLLPNNDIRYESYDAFDLDDRSRPLARGGQEFFAPVYQDPLTVIRSAVTKATFPETYRAWSKPERIGHWVAWLYRGRRQSGENGQGEDAAFGPDVWRQMTDVDPRIEHLLPDIIGDLARLEMADPDQLLTEFRRRAAG